MRLFGLAITCFGRALGDHLAAQLAGAGAEVDDPVGFLHRLLVVLDHQHRVAEVAQPLQRRDEPAVVSLVQPDGRLVENVDDAGELAAHLRGQADALALSARERRGRAVEREVGEAHVGEEQSRLLISLSSSAAICASVLLSGRSSKKASASAMVNSRSARCSCRAPCTARDSGLSRSPTQAGHGLSERNFM